MRRSITNDANAVPTPSVAPSPLRSPDAGLRRHGPLDEFGVARMVWYGRGGMAGAAQLRSGICCAPATSDGYAGATY
eukprot:2831204-Pleurochrysis_carterae.AAC.1